MWNADLTITGWQLCALKPHHGGPLITRHVTGPLITRHVTATDAARPKRVAPWGQSSIGSKQDHLTVDVAIPSSPHNSILVDGWKLRFASRITVDLEVLAQLQQLITHQPRL